MRTRVNDIEATKGSPLTLERCYEGMGEADGNRVDYPQEKDEQSGIKGWRKHISSVGGLGNERISEDLIGPPLYLYVIIRQLGLGYWASRFFPFCVCFGPIGQTLFS